MSSSEQAPEPTMDEILASIRRIIADEPTVSSENPSPPPGAGAMDADGGVVDDIARALSQGGDPAAPAGGDGILELTNELEPHAAAPQPSAPNAGHPNPPPHMPSLAEPPAPGHEAPPGAANHASQPAMPPAGAAFPAASPPVPEGAPQMQQAMPPAGAHDPAFPPPPGRPPVGGPPPQMFEGGPPNGGVPVNAGPMNAGPGAAPPPGFAPAAPAGQDDPLAAMNAAAHVAPVEPVLAPDAVAVEGYHPAAPTGMPQRQLPGENTGFGAPPIDQAIHSLPDQDAARMAPAPAPAGPMPGAEMHLTPNEPQFEPVVSETEFDISVETPEEADARAHDAAAIDDQETAVDSAPAANNTAENSFEKSVKAMLKPILRDWLDDNMPRILEGAMKDEMDSRGGNKNED